MSVTRLPLKVLWDARGTFGQRDRDLTRAEADILLMQQPLLLAVASLGAPIQWFADGEAADRWRDLRLTVADNDEVSLEACRAGAFRSASFWFGRTGERAVVLLEEYH